MSPAIPHNTVLGIDVGRTTLRVAVIAGSRRSEMVERASGTSLSEPDGPERIASIITELATGLDSEGPGAIAVASTGVQTGSRGKERLVSLLGGSFPGVPVTVTSDVVAAHAGALGGRPGVVVVAGTGSVALGVSSRGDYRFVDGAGPLLGDEGGAFWIGREGIRCALRHHDGREVAARLHRVVSEHFGELDALVGVLLADPDRVRSIAGFAPEVVTAARHGDPQAMDILDRATKALGEAAAAAARGVELAEPVYAVVGGLSTATEITDRLHDQVISGLPGAHRVAAGGDAIDGLTRLHTDPGLHRRLVHRFGGRLSHPGDHTEVLPDKHEEIVTTTRRRQ